MFGISQLAGEYGESKFPLSKFCYTRNMIDLEKRLRRTFSSMAANESLADGLTDDAAANLLKWGQTIAEQFVLKTGTMEDEEADEFLAPYSSALRKMMRALGHWVVEPDQETRLEWWNRIEQNGKTLYGDTFILPPMESLLPQLPDSADMPAVVTFIQRLIENQKAKG
jgi:hypothetical protein